MGLCFGAARLFGALFCFGFSQVIDYLWFGNVD
jgi:hypothetical protein